MNTTNIAKKGRKKIQIKNARLYTAPDVTDGAISEKMILHATGASGNCRIVLQLHKDIFATMCLSIR